MAEAVAMARAIQKKNKSQKILVDHTLFLQSAEVLKTRCEPTGIEIIYGRACDHDFEKEPIFAVVVQYPSSFGAVVDWGELTQRAHQHGALMICGADLLALCMLKAPGRVGHGHCLWDHPALWCSHGIWGAPCGLYRL